MQLLHFTTVHACLLPYEIPCIITDFWSDNFFKELLPFLTYNISSKWGGGGNLCFSVKATLKKTFKKNSNRIWKSCFYNNMWLHNHIGGVMVSVFVSSAVERGFEPRSSQTKDYKICCFSAKHAVLRSKSKDWLARNQNNVSEWSDMPTCGLLFQWASTIKIQLSMLV